MPKTMPSLLIISFFPPLPICLEKPFLFCCSMEPLSLCQMGCCPMHDSFDKTNVIFYNAQLSFCCCTDPSPPKLECPVWILFLPLTSHVTGALSYSILRRALSSHLLASAGKLESSTGSICPPPCPFISSSLSSVPSALSLLTLRCSKHSTCGLTSGKPVSLCLGFFTCKMGIMPTS